MSNLINLGDIAYLLKPIVPLKMMFGLARLQGRLRYLLKGRERSAVRNNLLDVFGKDKSEAEINLMTRQFFEYKQFRGLMLFIIPKLKPSQRESLFPVEGLSYLEQALEKKQGVILLSSHLNSIITFITKNMLRTDGYDIRVAIPTKIIPYAPTLCHKLIDNVIPNSNTLDQGGAFFAQFNIRPIVKALAENAAVILTGDGWHSASFVKVDFFGRQISFTTGAMSLARLTGSPVIPIFTTGTPGAMKVIIEEPIPLEKTEDSKRDLEIMVQKYAQRLEHHVRQNIPGWEHWLHDHALDTMAGLLDKTISERYQM